MDTAFSVSDRVFMDHGHRLHYAIRIAGRTRYGVLVWDMGLLEQCRYIFLKPVPSEETFIDLSSIS